MSKGSVINPAFVQALGLAPALHTLTKAIENRPHPTLLEPMFHLHVEEVAEPVYLERQYLYDHQFTIRSSYGAGQKVLLWMRRTWRRRSDHADEEPISLLLASDLFLMDDSREFLRFRLFLRSQRIRDAQARDFLAKHAHDFPTLSQSPEGLARICACLGSIAEWPDPENGFRRRSDGDHTLEGLAKTYSRPLAAVRGANAFPRTLLTRSPEERANIFRIMCFVEDPERGAPALLLFLRDLGQLSHSETLVRLTAGPNGGAELQRAFDGVRLWLGQPWSPGG
jgi:hypothetical protein